MIKQEPYQNRIHIFHVTDGKIWTFKNEKEACLYTDSIQAIGTVGEHFKTFLHIDYNNIPTYEYSDIIIRDDFGNNVHIQDLRQLWNNYFRKTRKSYFRVPGTKRHRFRWYRRLKTTNERRQSYDNYDAYDDYGIIIRPRGARGYHGIPNSWDDYVRSDMRCWKKQRKTQWC